MTLTEIPTAQKGGCRTAAWIALAVLIALIAGFFWFNAALDRLFGRITPGSRFAMSDSMEPFEIVSQTAQRSGHSAGASDSKVLTWTLNVPRAFVTDLIGSKSAVGPSDLFFPRMGAVYDAQTASFTPFAQSTRQDIQARSINIGLENGLGRDVLFALNEGFRLDDGVNTDDFCVREDDFADFAARYGEKTLRVCLESR